MTIEEMHASILLEIDRVGSYSTSNLIPGEIDDYINKSQRQFINQYRRLLREYTKIPQGAEAHENLRTLTETDIIDNGINVTNELENGFVVDLTNLSQDYDYYISGKSYFSTPNHYKAHKLVNKSYINKYSESIDNQHPIYEETPVVIDDNRMVGLYGVRDGEVPDRLIIDYLREPVDVFLNPNDASNNVDCELPEDVHRQIVNMATQNIIQSLSGQQQTNNQQSQE